MNEDIKKVLNKLIDEGYQAYIVGGYVRDYLLKVNSFDVDIATNAKPNVLMDIFPNASSNNYGGITFKLGDYTYDITTFRKELSYEDRRPNEFVYVSSIEEDAVRRDFTINAIYMDVDNNIIDLYAGASDLINKTVRIIGNINDRLVEDPLRMLRAIRFKVLYGFDIEDNLLTYIKQNKELIKSLSYTRRKEELDLIIESNNRIEGLKYIKELNLEDVLEISIPDDIKDSTAPIVMWAQIKADNYSFTKNELAIINDIKTIIEYGIIDNIILYRYGIYTVQLASDILEVSHGYVSDIYKEMPIYTNKDIDITTDEILDLLDIEPGSILKDIYNDLEIKILSNELDNNHEELIKYIKDNWR